MKKILNLLILSFLATLFACSPLSQVSFGDRTANDVANSQQAIDRSIYAYRSSITELRKENLRKQNSLNYMFRQVTNPKVDSLDSLNYRSMINQYQKDIVSNDSLIKDYQYRIGRLQSANDYAVVDFTERKNNNSVTLKGRNPYQLAEAYAVVKYLNSPAGSEGSGKAGVLRGEVENATYYENTSITVTGPAGFEISYTLGPKEKSPVFYLPTVGKYTATVCTSFGDCSSKTEFVGPNKKHHDTSGRELDFYVVRLR